MRGVDVGSDADALEMRDFGGGALFDGDVLAVGDGKVEGGDRGGDEKGDVFSLARTASGRCDLLRVAVGGDAVAR